MIHDNKNRNNECHLCNKELFSDIAKGCKMCGMSLTGDSKDFCSEKCKKTHVGIHKNKYVGE